MIMYYVDWLQHIWHARVKSLAIKATEVSSNVENKREKIKIMTKMTQLTEET